MSDDPSPPGLAALYRELAFPAGAGSRPFVAINMVSTADGKAAVDGQAAPISGPADRVLMGRLRAAVDCVLVGAGTVRAEVFDVRLSADLSAQRVARGQPPRPLAAIITNSGDLPLGRRALLRPREPRTLVFTSERALATYPERFAPLREATTVLAVGAEAPDLPHLLRTLAGEFGVARLLVEGGPALNQALFEAGLVDELFLTLASRIAGGRGRTIVEGAGEPRLDLARLALVSAVPGEDALFLRYRVVGAQG